MTFSSLRKLASSLCATAALPFTAPAAERDDFSAKLAEILEGSKTPGMVAAVVVDGKIAGTGAAGIRKKGAPEKVTVDDKFHIGSCTKSMTAVLAAVFVKEGKTNYDTTIGEVLTDMKIHEDFRDVTLQQLLTHTGGATGNLTEKPVWIRLRLNPGNDPMEERRALARAILAKEPDIPPGTKYEYSNAGYAITGAMLEKISGKPIEELLTKNLFEPLGMKSAGFLAPATPGKVDQPYGHQLATGQPVNPGPFSDNPVAMVPGGGAHCTVEDFAKWTQFHLGAIGKDILTEKERAVLYEPTEHRDYGMGMGLSKRRWSEGTILRHAGSNTMWNAVMWIAPEEKFAVVAMSNIWGEEAQKNCDDAIWWLVRKYRLKDLD